MNPNDDNDLLDIDLDTIYSPYEYTVNLIELHMKSIQREVYLLTQAKELGKTSKLDMQYRYSNIKYAAFKIEQLGSLRNE